MARAARERYSRRASVQLSLNEQNVGFRTNTGRMLVKNQALKSRRRLHCLPNNGQVGENRIGEVLLIVRTEGRINSQIVQSGGFCL